METKKAILSMYTQQVSKKSGICHEIWTIFALDTLKCSARAMTQGFCGAEMDNILTGRKESNIVRQTLSIVQICFSQNSAWAIVEGCNGKLKHALKSLFFYMKCENCCLLFVTLNTEHWHLAKMSYYRERWSLHFRIRKHNMGKKSYFNDSIHEFLKETLF